RLIGYITSANGTTYGTASYRLTGDIDMSTVAPGAYKTPSVNFNGRLTGLNPSGSTLQDNYYIYNLHLTVGTIRGTLYYSGLFSVLAAGSVVEHLNINQSSIVLSNTENFYSMIFYVGMVAGRLSGGTIENVQVDVSVHLGTQAIGQTHAGGIVGDGAGIIKKTSFSGSINAGNHIFNSSYNITPRYYIGGVVGSASSNALTLSEVVNNAPITGFSTSSTFNLSSGSTSIVVKMGGVIGFVVNTASINHSFVAISNKANITFGSVINTVSLPSTQSIGGVFGEITGSSAPILEVAGVYKNANYYNEGNIVGTYTPSSATIRAAGIGVINMSVQSEFALFYNHGTYSYNTSSISAPNTTFLYTGGIYNIGNGAVILSRIYNYADFNISNNYYTSINPLYYSSTSASTLIRYSANFGNIKFMNNNGLSTISLAASNPLFVSGITTSNNVNLLNVVNEGNIELVSLNIGANPIYVAGIKNFIPAGRYAKNILNQGNITVANITGTGGIYIGGITNQNLAGDLHVNGVNSATLGIINAINYGNITTSFGLKAQNLFGIKGNSNTFAAGIATLNAGSIQDVANLGNISLHNSSTSGSVSASTSTDIAGRINTYTAGLTAGGVVGVTLSGQARVFDSANSGDVVLISYQYARAGGILATSLFSEASAGGITSGLGLLNTIENSVLSNGLNYGAISALTNIIATYTNTANTQNQPTFYSNTASGTNLYYISSSGSELRPAIYSSAGGIIGYGLCVMTRMINHGTISATDVAGGIVGATYVLGTSSGTVTTVVNINTAIHYGKVKAVPNTSVMSGGTPVDAYLLTIANVSSFYLADNNTFIFPTAYTRLAPRNKRGFGGIFGRLQRGTNGIMTSEGGSFDFIVNADPNIDLIGRLDQVQNFSSSSRFFRFNNAIYYSARFNDTTLLVFTGFYYAESRYVSRTLSGGIYTVTMRAVNVFSFVGITSTLFSSPNTNFTFQTQTNSYTNTGTTYYAYYGEIPVPWITEDPEDSRISNSATQYMYDPAFSMRSNPDLTEYIYYMQPNLLSSRFQVGGQSPRPYGMYVLSTSFGSTFGLVLPANIREENLFLIDEDLVPAASLLSDYDAIPASLLKPIDQVVLDKYFELKQTIYNEKSAYISTENPPLILTESGGSSTILSNGVYNDIAKTVTFTISMEGFLVGQTIANWSVFSITSSANALVAKRINDYYGSPPSQAQLDEYNNLLFSQRFQGIATGSVGATLTTTLPSRSITSNQTISVGYFSIFSEAYINSDLFAHPAYYTDYQVFVTFTPTISNIPTGTIGINTVSFNGGGSILVSNQTDVSSLGDVLYNGSIRFNFLDTKGVWASGYDFKNYISIRYQDGSVVNPMYYSIVSTPVIISGSNRTYSVLITFSNQTK
ncbi:MAG: hypothetical protein U1C51_01450, partial [Candidatus Izemoplasmatales bacterium]|nr:hypothetical protein [Candidatus Izemoplasmatales bacterium]